MNQQIIKYLQENKDKKTREELTKELQEKGHKENEIEEALNTIYICSNPLKRDFWDFSSPKTYCSRSEKTRDFFVGLFGPVIAGIIFIIPFLGVLVYVIYYFYSIFYFYKRRKWISYGILVHLLIVILVIIILCSVVKISTDSIVSFLGNLLYFGF